jgi:hypothetical protein
MKTLCCFWLFVVLLTGWFSAPVDAQSATVISDTEAAQHVEGTVVKVFTSKNGNTFLNFGAAFPNQTFTGWIPKGSPVAGETSLLSLRGKNGANYRNNKSLPWQTRDQNYVPRTANTGIGAGAL